MFLKLIAKLFFNGEKMNKTLELIRLFEFLKSHFDNDEYSIEMNSGENLIKFNKSTVGHVIHFLQWKYKSPIPIKIIDINCGIHIEPGYNSEILFEKLPELPHIIPGDFWIRGLKNLKTVECGVEEVGCEFRIYGLPEIIDYKFIPQKVGSLSIGGMSIQGFKNFPKLVTITDKENGVVELADLHIKNLKGLNVESTPYMRLCWLNELESLYGIPIITDLLEIKGCNCLNKKIINYLKDKISDNCKIVWNGSIPLDFDEFKFFWKSRFQW